MKKEIQQIINTLKKEIKDVNNLEQLKQLKAKYLSKSDFYNELKNLIKTAKDKAVVGQDIKDYSSNVNGILEDKKNELENSFFIVKRKNPINDGERINLKKEKGIIHPITLLTKQVIDFFDELNYHYAHGIELEEEKYNFDILNLPKEHPAREMQDTFYLKNDKILRTHATNITARELVNTKEKVLRSYSIGPVFRNDDNDATHSFQFNQIDIFNVGEKVNISNLKWTLDNLMKKIFEKNLATRYRPSYFPFTEPSYEVDVQCPHCMGKKCNICSHTGWIEVLGSGMLSPAVFKNAGKNIDEMQGFAAGIGVERLAMMKWLINDIRNFYNNDLNFLRTYTDKRRSK